MLRPTLIASAAIVFALVGLAAQPAAARTGCDSYGRCFDFAGPSDRLGDLEALWQRSDAAEPAAGPSLAPAEPSAADPMALAHGTLGDSLQAIADDD